MAANNASKCPRLSATPRCGLFPQCLEGMETVMIVDVFRSANTRPSSPETSFYHNEPIGAKT
jgi:hypothetical protein